MKSVMIILRFIGVYLAIAVIVLAVFAGLLCLSVYAIVEWFGVVKEFEIGFWCGVFAVLCVIISAKVCDALSEHWLE
jgi:hypothetical protein